VNEFGHIAFNIALLIGHKKPEDRGSVLKLVSVARRGCSKFKVESAFFSVTFVTSHQNIPFLITERHNN